VKPTFIKCDYCRVDICEETGKCVFAVHRRVINGREHYFCCEAHADRFEKEKREKKK